MSKTYRRLLRLAPTWLRDRAGDEMVAVHEAKMREARSRGGRAVAIEWVKEMMGLLFTAASARRMDRHGAGGVDPVRRRRWGMESIAQDVAYTFRTMRRRPASALLATVTCGLGIGGAAAMFGVVDGVLLRPLPYPNADRIVSVYPTIEEWRERPESQGTAWNESFRAAADRASFSMPEFIDWMNVQTSFDAAAAVATGRATLTGLGSAEVLSMPYASPGLFAMLGATPVLGRFFADDARGEDSEVVVSWGFWQSRLGGANDVVGQSIQLNDRMHEIIGVLPRSFVLTGYDGDIWKVLGPDTNPNRDDHSMRVVARLAEGVTIERAREETATILRSLSEQHASNTRITHLATVLPRLEDETRQIRTPLLLLLAGAGLLLLVACVNFAALRLGSGIDRETELQLRAAIGAGRGRIVRQMLTESIVLALAGAVLGIILALGITRGLEHLAPDGIPRLEGLTLHVRAVAFAIGLAGLVGAVFGTVPALTLSRGISERLRATARSSRSRQRLHSSLVIAQTGLATVLLVCAGVLTRTLLHLDAVDPGFDADRLLAIRVQPPYERLRADGQDLNTALRSYYDRLVDGVGTIPGVTDVALASTLPFSGDRANNEVIPEGYQPETQGSIIAERNAVSGNYLEMIGVRVVEGRSLEPADDRADAEPVVVVSERLARDFWPDGAVGKRLEFWSRSFRVVGVIADVHDRTLMEDDSYRFYVPQHLTGAGGSLVVRTAADPASLIPAVRQRLAEIDPGLPVTSVLPMAQRIADSLAEQRYRARLAGTFALLAAAFTAFGIFGVTSRSVARRRSEIGVRLALGARPVAVVARILRSGLALAIAGIGIGLIASVAATRSISTYVYGTRPNDPLTLALVALGLVAAAALACVSPSLRAARTDPLQALRSE